MYRQLQARTGLRLRSVGVASTIQCKMTLIGHVVCCLERDGHVIDGRWKPRLV